MTTRPCSICGEQRTVGRGSRAEIICQPCRRIRNTTPATCVQCGTQFTSGRAPRTKMSRGVSYKAGVCCSRSCAGKWANRNRRRARTADDGAKVRRADLSRTAPGLNESQRSRLLAKWRTQGRTCVFCGGPCQTVEHLVPLKRGGTSFEGNLAPCCKSCNSRKRERLVIEFKWWVPPAETVSVEATWLSAIVPPRKRQPKAKPKAQQLDLTTCAICSSLFQPKSRKQRCCGVDCQYEYNNRQSRERYRAAVGLPPTWDRPSRSKRGRAA